MLRSMRRYYPAEIEVDFAVHLMGMMLGMIGALALLVQAATSARLAVLYSVLAYSVGLSAPPTGATFSVDWSSDDRRHLRLISLFVFWTNGPRFGLSAGSMWLAAFYWATSVS